MDTSIIGRIAALKRMSVAELRHTWAELYGEESRSCNRDFLFRRLAYRLQELQLGGLSDRARARLDELGVDGFRRARTPAAAIPDDAAAPARQTRLGRRDPRLPVPGSVISKPYKSHELRVTVRDDGYEFDGAMFVSLTAVAKHVTGSKNINGKLFFGLTGRKR